MNVTGTTSAGSTSGTTTGADKTVNQDQFLQLFTKQLQAQDPLNPMDSANFTAQLAQFSSLEQLTNINGGLQNLLLFQGSLQNTLTTGMIGKQVTLTNDETHTVAGVLFDNNKTYLELDNGSKVQLSDIKEIKGGA